MFCFSRQLKVVLTTIAHPDGESLVSAAAEGGNNELFRKAVNLLGGEVRLCHDFATFAMMVDPTHRLVVGAYKRQAFNTDTNDGLIEIASVACFTSMAVSQSEPLGRVECDRPSENHSAPLKY